MNPLANLTAAQTNSLVFLRLMIGWHFLYEGVIKVYSPTWTAKGYLLSATILQPFFQWLASEPILPTVDLMNIFFLLMVGTSLLIGFRTKWACWAGIGLLFLYYLAHPPFPGLPQGASEGSYWFVNKNLIEAAALFTLSLFPTEFKFGIERLFKKIKK
jgi:thiosulfate dehydrogenase [quinone] large subunit